MLEKYDRKSIFVVFEFEMPLQGSITRSTSFRSSPERPQAFSSLDNAKRCIDTKCKHLRDRTDDQWELESKYYTEKARPLDVRPELNFAYDYRFHIVEIQAPSQTMSDMDYIQSMAFDELVQHTWCFNLYGKLLWEYPDPSDNESDFDRFTFEELFNIGDRVYVIPQALEPDSESIEGDVAIVSKVPIAKNTWLTNGHDRQSWNPFYTVDFIDDEGYLRHYNVPESSLRLAIFSLPDSESQELSFLPLWSKFLQGELSFPEGLADRIRARKVYLMRHQARYDFESGSLIK